MYLIREAPIPPQVLGMIDQIEKSWKEGKIAAINEKIAILGRQAQKHNTDRLIMIHNAVTLAAFSIEILLIGTVFMAGSSIVSIACAVSAVAIFIIFIRLKVPSDIEKSEQLIAETLLGWHPDKDPVRLIAKGARLGRCYFPYPEFQKGPPRALDEFGFEKRHKDVRTLAYIFSLYPPEVRKKILNRKLYYAKNENRIKLLIHLGANPANFHETEAPLLHHHGFPFDENLKITKELLKNGATLDGGINDWKQRESTLSEKIAYPDRTPLEEAVYDLSSKEKREIGARKKYETCEKRFVDFLNLINEPPEELKKQGSNLYEYLNNKGIRIHKEAANKLQEWLEKKYPDVSVK